MRKFLQHAMAFLLTVAMVAGLTLVPSTTSQAVGQSIASGIDVSKHQGPINWSQVAGSGVKFAFIKAGSTASGVDPYFDANMRGAQAAGIKTGVYMYSYATSVEGAINEANMLVGWLSNYTVNYPVVYDVEAKEHTAISNDQLVAMVNAFCSVVSAAGYYPMVYSYRNFFLGKLSNVGYDKWVADYSGSCQYNNNVCFWQSSSHGSIPGIGTRVDIDYQYKDYSNLIISDGFLQRGEFVYYFAGYKMQRGWIAVNDTKYYLDAAGHLQRGWLTLDGATYYLTPADGQIARGQYGVEGANYYFDADGIKRTGWITVADRLFYYDAANDGKMWAGWLNLDGATYYMAPEDGHMLTGENTLGASIYNFGGDGKMLRGWAIIAEGVKYYYDPASGAKVFGWLPDQTGTHYLAKEDGHMVTGAITIDKANYYFDANGIMQTGIVKLADGDYYYSPADGKLQTGWIVLEKQTMYAVPTGQLVKGLATIDKATYYFDEAGNLVVNTTVTLDGTTYILDAAGVATVQVPEEVADPAAPAASAAPATTKK